MHWQSGNSRQTFGLDAELSQSQGLGADRAYLSGSGFQIRPHITRLLYPVYGQAFLNVQRQDIGDQRYSSGDSIPMGYLEWGPGAQLIGRISSRWSLNFSASYMQKKYDGLALPASIRREDRETVYGSRLTYFARPNISIYAGYAYSKNVSTLNDSNSISENYKQSLFIIGGVWDIF
jgi:hypothetical protein